MASATPNLRPTAELERIFASEEASEMPYYIAGEDQHPSSILSSQSKGTHRLGELYVEMDDTDPKYSGLLEKRWKAIAGLPRTIEGRDGTPEAQRMAEFARDALRRVEKLQVNLRNQFLVGLRSGVAFDELLWRDDESLGRWTIKEIFDRPMWRFGFVDRELRVRQAAGGLKRVHALKFLCNRCGSKDSPWGRALADSLYWIYRVKKLGFKFWSTYLDKYAMPTAIGKYPPTAKQDEQAQLLKAAKQIQSQYAVTFPNNVELDLLEAKRAGGISYKEFIAECDRAYAIKILGEVDTSGMGAGPGSYAKASVSDAVRIETVRADAADFQAHLTDNLLRPLIELNFGPEAPAPRWVIHAIDSEDRALRQAGIENARRDGYPVPASYYRMTNQIPRAVEGEELMSWADQEGGAQ